MANRADLRLGAILALVSFVLFFGFGLMHPAREDPGDSAAVFAEYAEDDDWIAVHLGQMMASLAVLGALFLMAASLRAEDGMARSWAQLGMLGIAITGGTVAVLQAVDGITLKHFVDAWQQAPPGGKEVAFGLAEAVRWTEVGVNAVFRQVFGLTIVLVGLAEASSRRYPRWLGWAAVLSGITWTAGGLITAYAGFSRSLGGLPTWAIMVLLVGNYLFWIWMLAMAWLMWRQGGRVAAAGRSSAAAVAQPDGSAAAPGPG